MNIYLHLQDGIVPFHSPLLLHKRTGLPDITNPKSHWKFTISPKRYSLFVDRIRPFSISPREGHILAGEGKEKKCVF